MNADEEMTMRHATPQDSPLISKYMATPVVTIAANETLGVANTLLRQHGISALLVVGRTGQPAGVISRRDLLRVGRIEAYVQNERSVLELPAISCGDLMSHPVRHIAPTASVADGCRALVEGRVHRVFVIDGNTAVGVFSTKEAMRAVQDARLMTTLGEVQSSDIVSVDGREPWSEAARLLDRAGVGGVVVMEQKAPIGLFTETEALAARMMPPETPTEDVMTQAMLCLPARTPLFRAAGFSIATAARRILVTHDHHAKGVVSGTDFARAYLDVQPRPTSGVRAETA